MPNKRKCIFGKFELELIFYPLEKKMICCTVQNPYKSEKHEATFIDKTEDKINRQKNKRVEKRI